MDDDPIRAIGFITTRIAYLEDTIDKLIQLTRSIFYFPKTIESFSTNAKVKELQKNYKKAFDLVHDYPFKDSDKKYAFSILEDTQNILKDRNCYIHSIYIGNTNNNITQHHKKLNETFTTSAKELYEFANMVSDHETGVMKLIMHTKERLLKEMSEGNLKIKR